MSRLFNPGTIINVGLSSFAEAVVQTGGRADQVEWTPPAAGDREVGLSLARLVNHPTVEAATRESFGHIVIACGGGGIPVVENADGSLNGLEAVIDKDFVSALMARELGADLFVVSTAVEKVAINFNRPNQRWLDRITLSEARQFLAEGHFPSGSMGPKIEAIVSFLEAGGDRSAIVTNPPNLGRALSGMTGTHILAG